MNLRKKFEIKLDEAITGCIGAFCSDMATDEDIKKEREALKMLVDKELERVRQRKIRRSKKKKLVRPQRPWWQSGYKTYDIEKETVEK
jgi:hypothetical protein